MVGIALIDKLDCMMLLHLIIMIYYTGGQYIYY
ncbi:hypothetical protein MED222_06285 [Vibrio sp. MED222]|nr:hypothetical protein MED222_06285 [Vibrio sp. MED222]